jgi:putative ABC transport system permease protein
MSTTVQDRPAPAPAPGPRSGPPANGGGPARRAVIRWAWRLFRREWRQQLLVLSLVTVALAATVVGGAVATNTPPRAGAGLGNAQDAASFPGNDPHLAASIAAIRHRFGPAEVIENQALQVPGSVTTFQLRAQNPAGPFGQPMLGLVSGRYPTGPGEVALTSDLARELGLTTGSVWRQGGGAGAGTARRVTGIVQNPQDLLDEFALVATGQVTHPTQVTVLFNAPGVDPAQIGPAVRSRATVVPQNSINPETILLALATVGMLLIALVGVGGFTVLAQRRLRALGLLGSLGATDKNIRLVIRANGIVTGLAGALLGTALGIAAWLAYRPRVQASAHHVIAPLALPWAVIGPAIGLAVLATWFAASRPAKAMARVPVVTALSGRPAPPKRVRRSAVPGVICVVVAFVVLGMSGASGGNGSGMLEVVVGFAALIAGIVLLAPTCLALLARLAPRTPVAVRLALRDLSRYRARSGSALAAISVSVLIAVVVTVSAAGRFGNVLDYAGPNLDPNQVVIHTPGWYPGPAGPGGGGAAKVGSARAAAQATAARRIAAAVGARSMLELDGGPRVLRPGVRGHPRPAPCVRDQPRAGQPVCRHPDHAAGVRGHQPHAGDLRLVLRAGRPERAGTGQLAVPAHKLPGRPGDADGRRAAVRHVGAQHGAHRARGASPGPDPVRVRLAGADRAPADGRADQQRPGGRRRGRADHRDPVQHPVGDRDHRLGHRGRDPAGAVHPGHVDRPDPQRDRQ